MQYTVLIHFAMQWEQQFDGLSNGHKNYFVPAT